MQVEYPSPTGRTVGAYLTFAPPPAGTRNVIPTHPRAFRSKFMMVPSSGVYLVLTSAASDVLAVCTLQFLLEPAWLMPPTILRQPRQTVLQHVVILEGDVGYGVRLHFIRIRDMKHVRVDLEDTFDHYEFHGPDQLMLLGERTGATRFCFGEDTVDYEVLPWK